ncbi:MAG TPA: GMC family oxidoreductase [Polyangiales bacterium]|nr:GMC family oxidoreductase [Polyangiales bacterium]
MRFERAHDVPAGSTLHTGICIIGSGAAGIALARQLDGSGKQVLLLEAGGLERDRPIEDEAFALQHLGVPYSNPCSTRGRWFGGSTNLWFGRIAMFEPIDFEHRPWVPHSGWPLSFDELSPWVQAAARILAVPQFERIRAEAWARHPALDLFVERGGASFGVFVWADGLYMGPFNQSALEGSRNVKVLLDATATALIPNESSTAIDALSVVGSHGNRFQVKAASYVLAAGGLENPRLLLASTARCEQGIGNDHDLVGRFYMDHPRTQSIATVDLERLTAQQFEQLRMLGEHSSPQHGKVQLRVTFPPALQRAEGLLNHSMHADFASPIHGSPGYQAAMRLKSRLSGKNVDAIGEPLSSDVPSDVRATLKGAPALLEYGLQKLRKRARPARMYMHDQMEQEPDPQSRVTVDRRRLDKWGLPAAQLDWRIGESTYRSQTRMHQLFKQVLERSGIHSFRSPLLDRPGEKPALMEMKHPSGTTRMSASPSSGVVAPDLRVHGVDNLYVAGSSVFPTVGHANPTLLIVALAARLAEQLSARE